MLIATDMEKQQFLEKIPIASTADVVNLESWMDT